ncbi:glycosyltransferase family 52 [Sphingobacterium sp. DR205]|uniref:glycosyltransferase family 52 n=1 Tax=Sphingobacterium sp. DR205 TaxID=2713573 RepID=UPI0013E41BCF|nr:glycosyltransferase family 52 [Sphingobacterium sp. DR205]QIH31568.1 hypothetical protein G6053_00985 [Sphingobacterium sp. DR205]
MTNIIVCVTPLQMLITENIIRKIGGNFIVIIITYDDNAKYHFYYERLKESLAQVKYFHVKSNTKVARFFNILKFKSWFESEIKLNKFQICCVSSIENPFVLAILSSCKYRELRTFDDGTANINCNSVYYRPLNISFLERMARYFSGIRMNRDDIRQQSSLHYTIYPGYKNIIDRVETINLLDSAKEYKIDDGFLKENLNNNNISLFLGQPIKDIRSYLVGDSFELFVKNRNIQYYFPHPREREKLVDIPSIQTDLIFEDFLAQLFIIKPSVDLVIYTFFSGAALNVMNYHNVKIISLINDGLEEGFKDSYDLLFESKRIKKEYF